MSQAEIKTVVKRVNVVRQRQLRVAVFSFVVIATGVVYYLGYQNGFDDRVPLVLDEAGLKARISKLETRHVAGTNRCEIDVTQPEGDTVVVTVAIDNLVKGASGQAIQAMNLMHGFHEAMGLESPAVLP